MNQPRWLATYRLLDVGAVAVPVGEKVDIFAPCLSLASAQAIPQAGNDLYFVPARAVKLLR